MGVAEIIKLIRQWTKYRLILPSKSKYIQIGSKGYNDMCGSSYHTAILEFAYESPFFEQYLINPELWSLCSITYMSDLEF